MTNRAKDFVAQIIAENDILMINVLTYYFSTRPDDEMLSDTISNTIKLDSQLKSAKIFFEVLPPISQSNTDMAETIVSFINTLFTKEQIETFNNHSAFLFLKNMNIT